MQPSQSTGTCLDPRRWAGGYTLLMVGWASESNFNFQRSPASLYGQTQLQSRSHLTSIGAGRVLSALGGRSRVTPKLAKGLCNWRRQGQAS